MPRNLLTLGGLGPVPDCSGSRKRARARARKRQRARRMVDREGWIWITSVLPWSKFYGEISPWNACPPPPQDGFHEHPIVVSSATWAPSFCQDRSDLRPLPIV